MRLFGLSRHGRTLGAVCPEFNPGLRGELLAQRLGHAAVEPVWLACALKIRVLAMSVVDNSTGVDKGRCEEMKRQPPPICQQHAAG